jgi:ribosome-binding protein aMBF1 (putative translation factor)
LVGGAKGYGSNERLLGRYGVFGVCVGIGDLCVGVLMAVNRAKMDKLILLDQFTVREIARQIGCHHTTVVRRKKKILGDVSDKSKEVRIKTKAALLKPEKKKKKGTKKGNGAKKERTKPDAITTPTREDIQIAVETNVALVREHRQDIRQGRELVGLIHEQLKEAAQCREAIRETIEKSDITPQKRAAMLKAVSIPAHAGALRDLSTALKNLIPLERQAFNLDDQESTEPLLEELKKRKNILYEMDEKDLIDIARAFRKSAGGDRIVDDNRHACSGDGTGGTPPHTLH